MKGKKKGRLIPLLILIIVGVLVSTLGGKKDPVENKKAAAIEVTATELINAYEENEVKANKMYKGKELEVNGIISNIGETLGKKYVSLKVSNNKTLTRVQCMFPDEETEKLAELKKFDDVTIIGICEGCSINVVLENCKIK